MFNIFDIGSLDFTGFIQASPLAVLVSDSAGKICFVNSQLESIFGYHAEDLLGNTVEMLIPIESRDQHVNQREHFVKERKSRLVSSGRTLKALHADGHEFYVQIGITTVGDTENYYTAAFIIDVSEKQSQDQRIRQMMESMPLGLLLTDESGKIIMTNGELDRIFGYERNSLIGTMVECLIPERLRIGHMNIREAYSKNPEPRRMGSGRDLLAVRRNGLEFPAEISLSPLNDNGEIRMLVVLSDISERKQLESTLRHQSCYDSLTNLPNRNLFLDRLDQACIKYARHNVGFAILMIDLDRFKEVNDSLGHPVGDIVLNEVGQRFEKVLRRSDSIARIGGDEFSAVLHNISVAEDAILLAEKLVESLRQPVMADTHALSIGASIGIALCPQHGADKNTLIAHADFAMYQAKRGVHSVVVDNTPPGQIPAPQQAIATEIEDALQRKELIFYYQPKVNLCDGTLIGVEALIRWNRSNMGIINPIEFIPAIEESPVLDKFTFATIEMAISQINVFQHEGNPLNVAVNLSARMLEHPHLVDTVGVLLKKYEIQPSLLALEITETALVINPLKARNTIEALEKYGVTFSIDDFGAGFTSFKYLKNFHFDEIKIDQEFITALQPESFDSSLVRSIAGFCKGLNIRLIAEGVETESVCQLLLELGCQFGQGYHIAMPMPIDKFNIWRRQHLKNKIE